MSLAFHDVSKSYPVYAAPGDRLKELVFLGRRSFHRDFWALRDCSFEIAKGSTFCVVGENGSGKSTALQLAAGIFGPTSGRVEAHGRVSSLLELGAGFNPEFSGRENVFLNGAILGLSTQEVRHRFDEITEFAEIGEFIDQPVKTYFVRDAGAAGVRRGDSCGPGNFAGRRSSLGRRLLLPATLHAGRFTSCAGAK